MYVVLIQCLGFRSNIYGNWKALLQISHNGLVLESVSISFFRYVVRSAGLLSMLLDL